MMAVTTIQNNSEWTERRKHLPVRYERPAEATDSAASGAEDGIGRAGQPPGDHQAASPHLDQAAGRKNEPLKCHEGGTPDDTGCEGMARVSDAPLGRAVDSVDRAMSEE